MSVLQLSLNEARHLHLAAQGLLKKPRRRARPKDILSTIQQMSLLQIDTINVVARSPYLVLFSRLGSYPQHWLDESLRNGELMEYWAHEACFLPRSDFALVRHRMLNPDNMGWKYHRAWMEEHAGSIAELVAHIGQNGPVRSADFTHPRKGASGWWEWKPHKRHLEGLFTAGEVMVVERRNFHRVYDLTRRVMPDWDDERDALSREDAEAIMLRNSARSLGIFRAQWLADYYRLRQPSLPGLLAAWQEEGLVVPVNVEALGEMWLHHEALAQLEKNYGREGAEILTDNCQDTIFGGFAPNSQTAEVLSKALGNRTVLSGSVSRGKNDPSQSLQMMEPLMTPDELKSIPKGSFVVMKTGTHPMQTKLRLFLDWGITFGAPYITPEHASRPVTYASRQELFLRIDRAYGKKGTQPTQVQQAPVAERRSPYSAMGLYNEDTKT